MTTPAWHGPDSGATALAQRVDLSAAAEPATLAAQGDSWSDVYTATPLLHGAIHCGRTVTTALPVEVTAMEVHDSAELIIPAAHAVAVLLAPDHCGEPDLNDAIVMPVEPGQILLIHELTWHSAAYGIEQATGYVWASPAGDPDKDSWRELSQPCLLRQQDFR